MNTSGKCPVARGGGSRILHYEARLGICREEGGKRVENFYDEQLIETRIVGEVRAREFKAPVGEQRTWTIHRYSRAKLRERDWRITGKKEI